MIVTFNPAITYNKPITTEPSFCGHKTKLFKDIFIKSKISTLTKERGLTHISGISGKNGPGTTCNGAITMKNFWSMFDPDSFNEIRAKGISTNKDGFPHCFLKAKSDVPISTSFVHDCSVMYLYNQKTGTHSLYHAAYDCLPEKLDFIIETLMPEGITHGSITPGDSYWYDRHADNLKNMFAAMKRYNKNSIINVYSESTKYPEIVGYKGKTYEIPNLTVQRQENCGDYISDEGQASFKIMDIQGYNTFDRIEYHCRTLKEVSKLKYFFRKQGYNNEMLSVLNRILNQRAEKIKEIKACNSLDTSYKLEQEFELHNLNTFWDVFRLNREKILLNELKNITTKEEFIAFYKKVMSVPSHSLMDKLHTEMAEKHYQYMSKHLE